MMSSWKLTRSLRAALFVGVAVVSAGVHAATAKGEPVTLVIANGQWLDALRGKALWEAMLKYEKVAPSVTLKQHAVPNAVFNQRMITEFGAGQGPDIAIMQDVLFHALVKSGFLVPLDKAVEGVANLNQTSKDGIVKGQRLGIAWQRAPYAMIYNKPLLDAVKAKVPTNVAELIDLAKAVSATGAVGFMARHQMNELEFWSIDFQNWFFGYGVKWVDREGKLTIDTPEAAAALAVFKRVYDARVMAIGDDMTTQRQRFKQKQVGLGFESSGGALNIISGAILASTDMVAAPLPFEHPGAHQQLFITVSRHSKNQEAAIDFVAWLVSADGQQALREASGPDTLATDVPLVESFRAANPWADIFVKMGADSRSILIPGYEVETMPILRIVMQAVERVLIGGQDPKSALAEAQQQVKKF